MITTYTAASIDSEDEGVPFTTREAARDWAVLEFEAIYEVDTAALRFEWRPANPEHLSRYFGPDIATGRQHDYEFMVVTELLGTPESWEVTKDELSWDLFIRTDSIFESAEEASQQLSIVTVPQSNPFEGGEYET